MATQTQINSVPDENFKSTFLTTQRNEILEFLANTFILPAYFLSTFFLIEKAQELLFSNFKPLRYALWMVAFLPVFNVSLANAHWRLGFKGRKTIFWYSVVLVFTYLIHEEQLTYRIFFWSLLFNLFELLRHSFLARGERHPVLNIVSTSLMVALMLLLGLLVSWNYFFNALSFLAVPYSVSWSRVPSITFGPFLYVLLAVFAAVALMPFVLIIQESQAAFRVKHRTISALSLRYFLSIGLKFLLFAGFSLLLIYSWDMFLSAVLGLAVLLLVIHPSLFASRQEASLANLFQGYIHDRIRRLVSPTLSYSSPLGNTLASIRKLVAQNFHWAVLIFFLFIGGVWFPYFLYDTGIVTSILELMTIGTVGSGVLAFVFLTAWFVRNRLKHIIFPFNVVREGGANDPNLDVIASLATNMFVEQLRKITMLLNMRQVENLSLRSDSGLPVFVTSGLEHDQLEQFRILGNIITPQMSLNLGNIFSTLVTQLAQTQVQGTVQRQDDNSVAIWVNFHRRDGRNVAVDMAFLPEHSSKDVDEDLLNEVAKTLAIKLLVNLGQVSHLGSSWQSLQRFLDGLDAGYQKNWRHAIASYREFVHIEETMRGSFGIGYYHLGATLLFQGEVQEGLKYLEIAEKIGPPLAETQYMIALGLFYLYQDVLHLERKVFTSIELRCKSALQLQPRLPEVQHLLGVVYYHRGRLRERALTGNLFDPVQVQLIQEADTTNFVDDYSKARLMLKRSLRNYDRAIRKSGRDPIAQLTFFDEQARLVEDRISATHRLGDALRSIQRYVEADRYYYETLAAFPTNARTLVDLAKTYCLARNWGIADEFLRFKVLHDNQLRWDHSASLMMGWTLLGGIADRRGFLNPLFDFWIKFYQFLTKRKFELRNVAKRKEEGIHFLGALWRDVIENFQDKAIDTYNFGRAVAWLDFTFHQSPRDVYSWQQSDWLGNFKSVCKFLAKGHKKVANPRVLYDSELGPASDYYVLQLQYWLAWRVLRYDFTLALELERTRKAAQESSIDDTAHVANQSKNGDADKKNRLAEFAEEIIADNPIAISGEDVPNPDFFNTFVALQTFSNRYREDILVKDGVTRKIKRISRVWDCLTLGEELFYRWKSARDLVKRDFDNDNQNGIPFRERWSIDIFADLSLLTVKVLVEGKAYDYAHEVAHESSNLLDAWINKWIKLHSEHEGAGTLEFTFSHKVASFQLGTLFSWVAFTLLMKKGDRTNNSRRPADQSSAIWTNTAELVNAALEKADSYMSHNSLSIYTKAIQCQNLGLYREAADELNRLITLIAPFDPHRYLPESPEIREPINAPGENRGEARNLVIQHLTFQERISGRLQTDLILNKSLLHHKLSKLYTFIEEYKIASVQLLEAIGKTIYNDHTAEYILELSRLLNKEGRYKEARTAAEDAKNRHQYLSVFETITMRSYEPYVLELIIDTNLERYPHSLKRSEQVTERLQVAAFVNIHRKIILECQGKFKDESVRAYLNPMLQTYLDSLDSLLKNEEEQKQFEELVEIVREMITSEDLSPAVKENLEGNPDQFSGPVFSAKVMLILALDILNYIFLRCELWNNQAFNWAELNTNLPLAEAGVEKAISLIDSIDRLDQVNGTEESVARIWGKLNQRLFSWTRSPESGMANRQDGLLFREWNGELINLDVKERLAQYYDTQAWIYFRQGSQKGYVQAADILQDKALVHGLSIALVHYHAARICLTKLETLWQTQPAKIRTNADLGEEAIKVSQLLRDSFLHWQHAFRLDQNQNLYTRLRLLRRRMDTYRDRWTQLQLAPEKSEEKD